MPVLLAALNALKLVALDGTHLRGKHKEILLTASMMDGDHGIFLLAYAIVENESRLTWSWFYSLLRKARFKVNADFVAF